MPVPALRPALLEQWGRKAWVVALIPIVFALLTSADLAPFFAALSLLGPEVLALVGVPLLLIVISRRLGRLTLGSSQPALMARARSQGRQLGVAAGLASLAALIAGSIDLGALAGLVTALASVGDLGLWLWVVAAGIPEIAVVAAALLTVGLLMRTAFRLVWRRRNRR
jgi:hypothetical protein